VLMAVQNNYLLQQIPLALPVVSTIQARKDFRRERVLFNDVPFVPHKTDDRRCEAFSVAMYEHVNRMLLVEPNSCCHELYGHDNSKITEVILQRRLVQSSVLSSFSISHLKWSVRCAAVERPPERMPSLCCKNCFAWKARSYPKDVGHRRWV
jgi:hypothetical protein